MENLIKLVSIVFIFSSNGCWAQLDTLTDLRDGKKYRIKTISNTTWMIDNLDYEAKNSVELTQEQKDKFSTGLTQEQKNKFKEFNLSGRYYHFETADSVCPDGWKLPDTG